MNLQLKRPIIFFDLETTGVDTSNDRIVEISMIKVGFDGSKQIKTRRINPEMPIPAEATAVHGITDEDVKDEPTFKQIAKSLAQFIEGCDFGGFNSNRFDLPVLVEEFMRAEVDVDFKRRNYVDVQNIFHKKEQRTLVAAYKFYCDKDLENAHSAEADTMATYEVLEAQIERYGDIGNTVEELAAFSTHGKTVDFAGRIALDDKGVEVFTFGKYKGRSVAEIFEKELAKMERLNPAVAEYSVQMTYLQLMVDLPWNEFTEDNLDLKCAREQLDADHFGLEEVKDRILAVSYTHLTLPTICSV